MKSYVITVPKLFNSLDSHKVWIQADSTEGAVILLFDAVWERFKKGIVLDQLVIEERDPGWFELLIGTVCLLEDINPKYEEQAI